jgi:hypothetical protein
MQFRPIAEVGGGLFEHGRRHVHSDCGAARLNVGRQAGSGATADVEHLPLRLRGKDVEGHPTDARLQGFDQAIQPGYVPI